MTTAAVALDTTQYVLINAGLTSLILQSHRDSVRIAFSAAQPARGNTAFHELGGNHPPFHIPFTELGIWALAMTDRSGLSVTDQRVPIEISDRDNMGQAVFVQDQTTEELDVPLLLGRVLTSTAADTVIDDRTIELTTGHGALAGEILEIADVDQTFMQTRILNVAVDTITIDQPVNHVYPSGSTVVISNDSMLVDGSVTPQVFSILPLPQQAGDIVRIMMDIRGTTDMDLSTFGSDASLTNGCVLRIKRQSGDFRNIFNWKNNGDFINRSLDSVFLQPKQGNTIRAFVSRSTFGGQSKRGVVIRLDGSLGEEIQVVIQDDLTAGANTEFRMIAQGHELQAN